MMAAFSVLSEHDGRMQEHVCASVDALVHHMLLAEAEQIELIVLWALQANRGGIMRDGRFAIVCTSGRRAAHGGKLMQAANLCSAESRK